MAFCTNCGAPLSDGARFCTSCGTPVSSSAPAPAPKQKEEQTYASDSSGEVEMSAWGGEFVPDGQEPARPAPPSRPAPKPYEQAYQQAFPQQAPYQQAPPPPPPSYQQQQPVPPSQQYYQQAQAEPVKPKKKLTFGRILYLALVIIIGLYLLSQLISIFAS